MLFSKQPAELEPSFQNVQKANYDPACLVAEIKPACLHAQTSCSIYACVFLWSHQRQVLQLTRSLQEAAPCRLDCHCCTAVADKAGMPESQLNANRQCSHALYKQSWLDEN